MVLQSTGDWLMSMLPDDPESTILKRLKRPRPDDADPADTPPERRGALGASPVDDVTYGQSERLGLRKLIEGTATR